MKLLIADDDEYTRDGLAENIDWEMCGIDEVMRAENGNTALKIAAWFQPDIVISDIRMPQKDGIEFSRELLNIQPACRIILITGYMQVDYLKSAIDLSVTAFIEKPIQISKVIEAVDKAALAINRVKEQSRIIEDMQAYQKKRLVHLLFTMNSLNDRIIADCLTAGFPIKDDMVYRCCYVENREAEKEIADCVAELNEYFEKRGFSILTGEPEKKRVPFILAQKRINAKEIEGACKRFTAFKTGYIIAAGSCVDNIDRLYMSGQMADTAWQSSYFDHERRYFEINESIAPLRIDPGAYHEFLDTYNNTPFNLRDWYNGLTENLIAGKYCRKDQVVSLTKACMHKIVTDKASVFQYIDGFQSEREIEGIAEETLNINELRALFNTVVDGLEKYLVENGKYSKLINDIRDFCVNKLSDPCLGGQSISDRFELTSTYINTLFKQELGITVKQYVSKLRMEKAKDFLRNSYHTVDEIAALCGYSTGNYFTKAFKEMTNMTPTAYRKDLRIID
jgi:two-component system response regulator YesN